MGLIRLPDIQKKRRSQSEDAPDHWYKIGHGRGWYNPRFAGREWKDIPEVSRKNLSRMMNSQQGKKNKNPPTSPKMLKDWRAFSSRRVVGRKRGDEDGHYTPKEVANMRGMKQRYVLEGGKKLNVKDMMEQIKIRKSGDVQKGKILQTLIFGLVAGAGGFVAGQVLRKKLKEYGMSATTANDAVKRAMDTAYEMNNRRYRLVTKGQGTTYIRLDIDMVMKQVLRAGEYVMVEGKECLVTKGGNKFSDIMFDGKRQIIDNRLAMRMDEIIYTEKSGMTTWDRLDWVERGEIVAKCQLRKDSQRYSWELFDMPARDYIRSKYGDDKVKAVIEKRYEDIRKEIELPVVKPEPKEVIQDRYVGVNPTDYRKADGQIACQMCKSVNDDYLVKCDSCGYVMKKPEQIETERIAREANEVYADVSKSGDRLLNRIVQG